VAIREQNNQVLYRLGRCAECARNRATVAIGGALMSDFGLMTNQAALLSYGEFQRVDIRVGRVVDVQDFPEARKPAYKLRIDFGAEIGIRKSSAQATKYYSRAQLLNRLVVAVVNFPPKQIGPYLSEVLTLGVPDGDGGVVLLVPERDVPLGARMF
jgi:tRNA-binding protein